MLSSMMLKQNVNLLEDIVNYNIKMGCSLNDLLGLRDYDDYYSCRKKHDLYFRIFKDYINSLGNISIQEVLKYEMMHINALKKCNLKLKNKPINLNDHAIVYRNFVYEHFECDITSMINSINKFDKSISIDTRKIILIATAKTTQTGNIVEVMEVDNNTYNLFLLVDDKLSYEQILNKYRWRFNVDDDLYLKKEATTLFNDSYGYVYWHKKVL